MMNVSRPSQCEKHVDIKQMDGHRYRPGEMNSRPASKSSWRIASSMSSGPKRGVPAGT